VATGLSKLISPPLYHTLAHRFAHAPDYAALARSTPAPAAPASPVPVPTPIATESAPPTPRSAGASD
jgi:hypothetical protein